MKDRDLHTRNADEILWSDGNPLSQDLSPKQPEEIEEPETYEKLTKADRALGFTIALLTGVILGVIYAIAYVGLSLAHLLGGKR